MPTIRLIHIFPAIETQKKQCQYRQGTGESVEDYRLEGQSTETSVRCRAIEHLLYKHEISQANFLAIMSEFWQTNAFFTAFSGLTAGTILANWDAFAQAGTAVSSCIVGFILFLMAVWAFTLRKHNYHSFRLQRKLASIEARLRDVEGLAMDNDTALTIYEMRTDGARRALNVRGVWRIVPYSFAIAFAVLFISAVRA